MNNISSLQKKRLLYHKGIKNKNNCYIKDGERSKEEKGNCQEIS